MEEATPSCSSSYELIPVPTTMKAIDYDLSLDEQNEAAAAEEPEAKKAKLNEDQPPSKENRKIYIGNLPPSVTEKPLVSYFRAFGHVIDCHVIRDKESGVSRGFAFLTFLDESEAETAVEHDNHKLDGKPIHVAIAQKTPKAGSSSLPRKAKDASLILESVVLPSQQCRVYLGPLDDSINAADLTAQLSQYGKIKAQ